MSLMPSAELVRMLLSPDGGNNPSGSSPLEDLITPDRQIIQCLQGSVRMEGITRVESVFMGRRASGVLSAVLEPLFELNEDADIDYAGFVIDALSAHQVEDRMVVAVLARIERMDKGSVDLSTQRLVSEWKELQEREITGCQNIPQGVLHFEIFAPYPGRFDRSAMVPLAKVISVLDTAAAPSLLLTECETSSTRHLPEGVSAETPTGNYVVVRGKAFIMPRLEAEIKEGITRDVQPDEALVRISLDDYNTRYAHGLVRWLEQRVCNEVPGALFNWKPFWDWEKLAAG